jgi:predicted RNase H-like HicB family nuclease
MDEMTTAFDIRVVLFEDEKWWCAQCLEYDITAQAKTLPELRYELERVLFAHVCAGAEEGRAPFQGLERAPSKYWRMYETADTWIEGDDFAFRGPVSNTVSPVVAKMKIAELAGDCS